MATHRRQIARIDRQLAHLAECQRRWNQGTGTSEISEAELYAEIDRLLADRHALVTSQGELIHPDDVATVTEWGSCG